MSRKIIISVIFGLLLVSSAAIAQKGKIKKAYQYMEALDYQSAIDILLPLAENNSNPEIPTLLGDIFRKRNSPSRAAVWYEKAISLEGVKPSSYYYYGMMLLHTGKCSEAQEQFDYFLNLSPLDPRQFQLKDACTYHSQLLEKNIDSMEVQVLNFNSVFNDIGPAFYRSGLVFGSVRTPIINGTLQNTEPFYDLYYAQMEDNHFQFSEPVSFSDRINTKVHEAIVTFSQDGSKIYFTRTQGVDNEHSSATATGLEIVYANSEDGERWEDLQLLPFHSPKYSIAHPSLSQDGQMLFFSSDMPGGYGGKDIYVSTWDKGYWGKPFNLGPLVNTEGDEMFPFYHVSGKLYFSSDGQVGLGGQDIFSTQPNKAGVWAHIQNLGSPINTQQDDYGIIVAKDESYGYFTSNRPGGIGKDDIYGFQLPQMPQMQEELVTQKFSPEVNKVVVHVQLVDARTGQRIESVNVQNCEANLYRTVGTSSFQMNLYPGECCEVEVGSAGYQSQRVEICGDPSTRSRTIALRRPGSEAPPAEALSDNIPSEPEFDETLQAFNDTEPEIDETLQVFNESAPEAASIIPDKKVIDEATDIVTKSNPAQKTTKYFIGTVYDPINSRPIPFATIHLLNSTCGVNVKVQSDESGHYRLPLIADCCINIRVDKDGFQTYTALDALCTDKSGNVTGSTSILLKPAPPKVNTETASLLSRGALDGFEKSKNTKAGDSSLAFILNVYYESARTSVNKESVEDLKKLTALLEDNPTLIVEIGAHTDSKGTKEYNQDLSQRRAENVVKYLISQGIYSKRLIPKGYGESQLINDCEDNIECSEAEHQENRRTEFRVIGSLAKND